MHAATHSMWVCSAGLLTQSCINCRASSIVMARMISPLHATVASLTSIVMTVVAKPNATEQGHAAHTKAADSQQGLRGKFNRPINVTFFGAGSGFCPTLCRDVLLTPGAERGEFRLCDIDADRLATMQQVITKLIRDAGRGDGWT